MYVYIYIYTHTHTHTPTHIHIYIPHFLYSSVSGHLGCFHTLAIMNNEHGGADTFFCVCVCGYPEVELLGHAVVLFLIS